MASAGRVIPLPSPTTLAPFPAQPFGPGLLLRDAALLVAYLE